MYQRFMFAVVEFLMCMVCGGYLHDAIFCEG